MGVYNTYCTYVCMYVYHITLTYVCIHDAHMRTTTVLYMYVRMCVHT